MTLPITRTISRWNPPPPLPHQLFHSVVHNNNSLQPYNNHPTLSQRAHHHRLQLLQLLPVLLQILLRHYPRAIRIKARVAINNKIRALPWYHSFSSSVIPHLWFISSPRPTIIPPHSLHHHHHHYHLQYHRRQCHDNHCKSNRIMHQQRASPQVHVPRPLL